MARKVRLKPTATEERAVIVARLRDRALKYPQGMAMLLDEADAIERGELSGVLLAREDDDARSRRGDLGRVPRMVRGASTPGALARCT